MPLSLHGLPLLSECPPTFVFPTIWSSELLQEETPPFEKAVENAEDDADQAWKDLQAYNITENDVVIGLAASGNTPYVVGGLQKAKENNLITGHCLVNNRFTLVLLTLGGEHARFTKRNH